MSWLLLKPGGDALDELWAPLAGAKVPVLIGLPSPVVYAVQDPPSGGVSVDQITKTDNYFVGTGAEYGAALAGRMRHRSL